MEFIISKSKLQGSVKISGAKNSVLKLLAASILTHEKITLYNYPASLIDAQIQVSMLNQLGKVCFLEKDILSIEERNNIQTELLWEGQSIRTTLLVLGALLTRLGFGKVPLPGGCKLGERKYDLHVDIFQKLGAEVWEENGFLCAKAKNGLVGNDIFLPIRSTGATENGIICGSLAKGTTRIWNPHIRPEIIDLANFLNKMGAKIIIHGQEHIEIMGVEHLYGTQHHVMPDNMEALTWLVATAITGGDLQIYDFPYEHLEVPLIHLRESGCKFYINESEHSLIVRNSTPYPIEISTGPYPGINSDMQPLFAVYAACAKGQSKIVDLRFPNRYGYADELIKMGLDCEVKNNILVINGGRKLVGARVKAIDLRAGAALLLAGMVAEGKTIIEDSWMIERGYDNIFEKLKLITNKV